MMNEEEEKNEEKIKKQKKRNCHIFYMSDDTLIGYGE